jgi:DNA/RNA endonuclease G (NUC1)
MFLAVLPANAVIDASLQMQLGNPSSAISDTNNHNHYLIQRAVEAIDYSDNLGEPNWASWDLTAGDVGTNARSSKFFTDSNLPPNFYWVTDNDYNGVGAIFFNRGHLCPSEDRTDTRADNDAVFLMSNIMPQDGTNNSGVWGTFEGYCRTLAQTNELLVICGPSGFGTNIIPSGKAYIADYVWKIAVIVPTNSGTALSRITSSTRVIALKIPNSAAATNTWPNYVTSASQIEVDTGLTFFTALPADLASALRNKVDGQTNPPPVIFAFSPTNGTANTNAVITGMNFTATTAVTFNGVSAAFNVDSSTQITATVPMNGSTGFISVTTPSGTAISSNSFVINGGLTVFNGTLAGWDVSALTGGTGNYGPSPFAPTTNAPNLTCVGLTRGSGVGTGGSAAGGAWGGVNFTNATAALAVASNKFVTFSVTANAGYQVSFSSVSRFDYRRSGTGPTNGVLQFQIGSGAFADITNFNYPVITGGGGSIGAIDLSGFAALQNIGAGTNVTFRIVNYLGTGSTGSWYISDVAGSTAPDLALQGIVAQVSLPATNPPAATPTFSSPAFANNQFQFTLTGTTGSNYVVQASTNLAAGNWISLQTNAAPFLFIESNANLFLQRFYRGVVAP